MPRFSALRPDFKQRFVSPILLRGAWNATRQRHLPVATFRNGSFRGPYHVPSSATAWNGVITVFRQVLHLSRSLAGLVCHTGFIRCNLQKRLWRGCAICIPYRLGQCHQGLPAELHKPVRHGLVRHPRHLPEQPSRKHSARLCRPSSPPLGRLLAAYSGSVFIGPFLGLWALFRDRFGGSFRTFFTTYIPGIFDGAWALVRESFTAFANGLITQLNGLIRAIGQFPIPKVTRECPIRDDFGAQDSHPSHRRSVEDSRLQLWQQLRLPDTSYTHRRRQRCNRQRGGRTQPSRTGRAAATPTTTTPCRRLTSTAGSTPSSTRPTHRPWPWGCRNGQRNSQSDGVFSIW